MKMERKEEKPEKRIKPEFDYDFSPSNPHNEEVAKRLGVKYNPPKKAYVDKDGCVVFDEFGQRF